MPTQVRKFAVHVALLAASLAATAQQKINPITQINWPVITGSGAPATVGVACGANNYGQPYLNIGSTPNTLYNCGNAGWQQIGAVAPNWGIYGADTFAGADPSIQINACLTATAAANAVCDARMFTGSQTMSQQITVPHGTALLIPQVATWTWTITDGVSAGILQQSSSSIIGTAQGGAGGTMKLHGNGSVHMLALYATDASPPAGGGYVYASGFLADNYESGDSGNVFTHGLIYPRNLFDEGLFERITATNIYGDAWHILNVCCTTNFFEVAAGSGGGPAGGVPLTVEPGSGGLGGSDFQWSGTINDPGDGFPNVKIDSPNYYIDFPNVHMEADPGSTHPMIDVDTSVNNPNVRLLGGHMIPNAGQPCVNNLGLFNYVDFHVCAPASTMNNLLLNLPKLPRISVSDLPPASFAGPGAVIEVIDNAISTYGPCTKVTAGAGYTKLAISDGVNTDPGKRLDVPLRFYDERYAPTARPGDQLPWYYKHEFSCRYSPFGMIGLAHDLL